jgi:hypothetical protein
MATLVKFRKDETGEIFAYFPQLSYYRNNYLRTKICYTHIGQHSACAPEYAKECKQANEHEYLPLLQELQSIGYTLKICKS